MTPEETVNSQNTTRKTSISEDKKETENSGATETGEKTFSKNKTSLMGQFFL